MKKEAHKSTGRTDMAYETAVCLARMWGVMETLEDIPAAGQEEVCRTVTAWAEEFAAGSRGDLTEFFYEKSREAVKDRHDHSTGTGGGLLGRVYDKAVAQEAHSRKLDEAYHKEIEALLEPLKGAAADADVERISSLVYRKVCQARKDGFLQGAGFMTRLLSEAAAGECDRK